MGSIWVSLIRLEPNSRNCCNGEIIEPGGRLVSGEGPCGDYVAVTQTLHFFVGLAPVQRSATTPRDHGREGTQPRAPENHPISTADGQSYHGEQRRIKLSCNSLMGFGIMLLTGLNATTTIQFTVRPSGLVPLAYPTPGAGHRTNHGGNVSHCPLANEEMAMGHGRQAQDLNLDIRRQPDELHDLTDALPRQAPEAGHVGIILVLHRYRKGRKFRSTMARDPTNDDRHIKSALSGIAIVRGTALSASGFRKKPPAKACQHGPLSTSRTCQPERTENLRPNPWPPTRTLGVRVTPGDPLFKTETAGTTNTCKMFGIWVRPEGARVKLNRCPGSTDRTVAPRHGFEPRFTAPKAAVLPLDDRGLGGMTRSTSLAFPSGYLQRLC